MQLPLGLLALCALVLASPTPPKPRAAQSIPLRKSLALSTPDGVANTDALRSHAAYLDSKYLYSHDGRKRETAELGLTSYRDAMWYGAIQVGSRGQDFLVDFDTGSTDLFLPSSACLTCAKHTPYAPQNSSTSQPTNQSFTVSYGDGSAALGQIYLDSVSLSGLTATGVPIGAATFENGSFTSGPTDGLLGLAYPAMSAYKRTPYFNLLVEQGVVPEAAFAFNLAGSDASLFLGGTDAPFIAPSSPIHWNPVVRKLYWEIDLTGIELDRVEAVGNSTAIIDTGTTLLVGPPADIAALYAQIPNSAPAPANIAPNYYTFPCSQPLPEISILLGGVRYILDPQAFNFGLLEPGSELCVGAAYAMPRLPRWILGDVFLRGFAAVFDFDGDRIGFAQLA